MDQSYIKILGLLINDRGFDAVRLQSILTTYGNIIKTRLGVNHPVEKQNIKALMLFELFGDREEMINLENELKEMEGIQVQTMEF